MQKIQENTMLSKISFATKRDGRKRDECRQSDGATDREQEIRKQKQKTK